MVREKMFPSFVLKEVADLNRPFRDILKGTVWENYDAARHAMAERQQEQDRSARCAGADLSRQHHARNLQPGRECRWRRRAAWRVTATRRRITYPATASDFTFILEKAQCANDACGRTGDRQGPGQAAHGAVSQTTAMQSRKEEIVTDLTRRKMLGVAAGTMASRGRRRPASPEPAAADDAADLRSVRQVVVRADRDRRAQTGADRRSDPGQARIFQARQSSDPSFRGALMQIVRANPSDPAAAADSDHDATIRMLKYLGRSIILAWYLGVWYEPNGCSRQRRLRRFRRQSRSFRPPPIRRAGPGASPRRIPWATANCASAIGPTIRCRSTTSSRGIGSPDMCADKVDDFDAVIVGSGIPAR